MKRGSEWGNDEGAALVGEHYTTSELV